VAIVPDESPTTTPEADFGANDWLLEEMYERYITDPSSVDETWAEYFQSHGAPGTTSAGDGAAAER
jgi:multifunctional 2-oxoglutarate metabolism enzyme